MCGLLVNLLRVDWCVIYCVWIGKCFTVRGLVSDFAWIGECGLEFD